MFITSTRKVLLAALVLVAPLAACGSDDSSSPGAETAASSEGGDNSGGDNSGGDDSGSEGGDGSGSESESEGGGSEGGDGSFDIGAVSTCLADAGFGVTREADQDEAFLLPQEYKDSVGLIENVQLGVIGDAKGTGAVAFFDNVSAALDEFDAASSFRSEDVQAGTVGTANWDYIVTAGDDPGVAEAIQGCLS